MDKQIKILIADDSIVIHETIMEILKEDTQREYTFFSALNGREACSVAIHEKPDIILMDIEMPLMNGIEATRKIKKHDALKHIPIIISSSRREFDEAYNAGANDFLLKPYNNYELLQRIQLNLDIAFKALENKKQQELLKAQKQEVIFQRDLMLKQQTEINEDLQYARFIQNAIMPEDTIMNEIFPLSFIFNKPKNIVSGDFFWVSKKNDCKYIAVGDCTGHGISGALMTMAGTAFLNEIVNTHDKNESDVILNELRNRVMKLLHQKGEIGEASNGMDISLCIINQNNKTIEYSGANNPIYYVDKNSELKIIKADRMPIGIHINHERPFNKQIIDYAEGDKLYLFTDGYADQFGGPMGQKFRYNQFQELIQKISSLPIETQLTTISNTIDNWMDGFEQVDDILIVGINL